MRFRVSRSETARLIQTGRIEETIHFAAKETGKLTYALELSAGTEMSLRHGPEEVTVTLPTEEARRWSEGDRVGLYRDLCVGAQVLVVQVEKDFACLDGRDAGNEDAFENPNCGKTC